MDVVQTTEMKGKPLRVATPSSAILIEESDKKIQKIRKKSGET
jgi:hypothetical protein